MKRRIFRATLLVVLAVLLLSGILISLILYRDYAQRYFRVKESSQFCSFLEIFSPKIPAFPLAERPFLDRPAIFPLQNCR